MNEVAKVGVPDFVKCPGCRSKKLEAEGEDIVCRSCDRRVPRVIDLCPACFSHTKSDGGSSVTRDEFGRMSPRSTCGSCGKKYTAISCLRVPFVWFCSVMSDDRMPVEGKVIDVGSSQVQVRQ